MGMIFTRVAFEGEMPTKTTLEKRLEQRTGLCVEIELIGDTAEGESGEWRVNFESKSDDFKRHIWCFRQGCKIHVQELADVVNRCPHYLLYATEAALLDLGGISANPSDIAQPKRKIPDYALGTFAEWKKQNHGSRPSWWRTSLVWIVGTLYLLFIGLAYLLLLPFILLVGTIIWITTRFKPA